MAKTILKFVKVALFVQIVGMLSAVRAIIDGNPTLVNHFPHQVSLRFAQNSVHFCAGSILNERWILSAAQCTQGSKAEPENIFAVAGATNLTHGGQRYDLDQIVNHPKFNWAKRQNDIAMLKTIEPLEFRDNAIFPIALPSFAIDYQIEHDIGLTPVIVSGWGAYKVEPSHDENELSEMLRSQDVNILNRKSCRRYLGHVNGMLLNEKQLCTGNRDDMGMCVGDVGSPLISQNREIVGIASWRGFACGKGYPDVYTRVYSHLNWIWSNLIDPDDL